MNTTPWKDLADLLGTAAIVASLIFVGMQLMLDRDTALADAITEQTNSYQYWADLVNSNADVWQRGLAGDQLTAADANRFYSLAAAYEMLYASAFERSQFVGGNPPARYATQWALQVHQNPGLMRYWRNSRQAMEKVRQLSNYDELRTSPYDVAWERVVNEQLGKIENLDSQ